MTKARDEVIANDPDLIGETWRTISIDLLHEVSITAFQKCYTNNHAIAKRINNLNSVGMMDKRKEKTALINLMEK